ncbi:MAG: polyprenyl synthetase family protein [Candidatus Korarchaeota archaeon]
MLIEYVEKINLAIKEFLSSRKSESQLIMEMLEYNEKFVMSGGKRIRPLLVILAYALNKTPDDRIVKAAISMEFLHNYFLVYDDIMDEAPVRRGFTTVHKYFETKGKEMRVPKPELFGVSMAILAGGLLKSYAVEALLDSGFPSERVIKALKILELATEKTSYGQALDLEMCAVGRIGDINHYYSVIDNKTAYYTFIAPLQIGGILGDLDDNSLHILEKFGLLVGRAFQIQDDLLDIISPESGKRPCGDLTEGKITLPLMLCNDERILSLRGKELSDEEIELVREIVKKSGAEEQTRRIIADIIEEARQYLAKLPRGKTQHFEEFLDMLAKRNK